MRREDNQRSCARFVEWKNESLRHITIYPAIYPFLGERHDPPRQVTKAYPLCACWVPGALYRALLLCKAIWTVRRHCHTVSVILPRHMPGSGGAIGYLQLCSLRFWNQCLLQTICASHFCFFDKKHLKGREGLFWPRCGPSWWREQQQQLGGATSTEITVRRQRWMTAWAQITSPVWTQAHRMVLSILKVGLPNLT